MKAVLWLSLCISSVVNAQRFVTIHQKAKMVDTHNDLLTAVIEKNLLMDADLRGKTHSDLNRFKEAGVDCQLFSVWCDGEKQHPYAWANREIDTLYAVAARNPDKITIVANSKQAFKTIKAGKIAAMFGVEGGHMIENDINKLDSLYARGVRYMTLTWNNSTNWASSAMTENMPALKGTPNQSLDGKKGLTDFGVQVVQRMNQLGMLVDLSHVGEQTFWDAIKTTNKPVLVSHSNAYALCPVFRNLKDAQIKAVAQNGGVIHLNFYSGFVDSGFKKREIAFMASHAKEIDSLKQTGMQQEYAMSIITSKYQEESNALRPPLSALLDHLDYIVKIAGVDHVGMGSDFDGITSSPQQLDDVTNYPLITKALLERGYSKKDIYKIMGGNFWRVLAANEKNK
ncbi:MAG: dipeptidase [Sediminibacterium sp.]|nr:dipeptidase [Sediminibacterium sp.]MBX9780420.1 dipeptidase [Chitinophagaceae bacterium]